MDQSFNSKPSSNSLQPSQLDSDGKQSFQLSAPSISLPKGGGAIRGMGQKFAANPVTGTGSMTVPIATSSGRSGFGPQLSLFYDFGIGNSPCGIGWSLSHARYHTQDRQGSAAVSRCRGIGCFYGLQRRGLGAGLQKEPDGSRGHDPLANLIYDEESRNGYLVKRLRQRILPPAEFHLFIGGLQRR